MTKARMMVDAAQAGNLEKVKMALTEFCSVNSVIDDDGIPVSAFAASVSGSHWNVAKFLILSGATLEMPGDPDYSFEELSACAYPMILIHSKLNEEFFSLILSYVQNLNPKLPFVGSDSVAHMRAIHMLQLGDVGRIKLSYILSEAIIAGNAAVIEDSDDVLKNVKFDLAIFAKHINRYSGLGPKTVRKAIKILPLFASVAACAKSDIDEIQRLLESKLEFSLTRNRFPLALRQTLTVRPMRNLHEMVCELLYWILPEEFPIPQPVSAHVPRSNNAIDYIQLQEKQGVARLLSVLELDVSEIVTRFIAACANDLREDNNPAILLLAQILYFHHNDRENDKPVFTPYQQSDMLEILNTYFALTPNERVQLRIAHQNATIIKSLQSENCQQKQTISMLQAQLARVEVKLDQLNSAVNGMVKQDPEQTKRITKTKSSGGLF